MSWIQERQNHKGSRQHRNGNDCSQGAGGSAQMISVPERKWHLHFCPEAAGLRHSDASEACHMLYLAENRYNWHSWM